MSTARLWGFPPWTHIPADNENGVFNMTEQTILKRKSGLMTANMNGDAVMMDISTGKYFNLGQSGGYIWELLEQPLSVENLIKALIAEYDVSYDKCKEDILPFLQQMVEKELLIIQ